MSNLGSVKNFENRILIIRGEKVILDRDLAYFYGVETKVLNQAVKRNIERFPDDFMFQLTEYEAEYLEREGFLRSQSVTLKKKNSQNLQNLRSQIVTSSRKNSQSSQNLRSQKASLSHGGRRYLPYVFTEQGVAMLSSVLSSKKAIEVNILIMRAFVNVRKLVYSYQDLADKLMKLEQENNQKFNEIFRLLDLLMADEEGDKGKKEIGFRG